MKSALLLFCLARTALAGMSYEPMPYPAQHRSAEPLNSSPYQMSQYPQPHNPQPLITSYHNPQPHNPQPHISSSYQNPQPHKYNIYPYLKDPMAEVAISPIPFKPMPQQPVVDWPMSYQQPMSYQVDKPYHVRQPTPFLPPMPYHQFEEKHLHSEPGFSQDTPSYTVLSEFPGLNIEERYYPSQKWVCTKRIVDTAADPFAGLEHLNPVKLLESQRHKEGPTGRMYSLLQDYISGENKVGEEMSIARPVSVHHWITKKKFGGNEEVQEMCFYLEDKYQAMAVEDIPEPENDAVYIFIRPELDVYVTAFEGIVATQAVWETERQILDDKLHFAGKEHHDREYYTQCYNFPLNQPYKRSEVWIQKLEPSVPVIAAVVAEVPEDINSYLPVPQQEAVEADDEDVQNNEEKINE